MQAPNLKGKRSEIKRRYRRRRNARAHTAPQMATLRLNDLARLFRARWGVILPDDDAGRDDLTVALCHISTLSTARARMVNYCQVWAPWLTLGEASAMIDYALTKPERWNADQLAWRLHLTAADRSSLGITTIGAVDMNHAARVKARKARARARCKALRRAKGAKPRAAHPKPWIADGISRASWYRKHKPRETGPNAP